MATPVDPPPASISFNCSDMDELFISLDKLTSGSPLPINVIDYVNPYGHDPQNLPEAVWFLISSKDKIDMESGAWKTKEEACEVFSNSDIIGWRTTLEYFDGQVPHRRKTDWVMEMFNVTMKRLRDDNEKKETSYLCRVNLVPSHEIVDNGTGNHFTSSLDLDCNSSTRTPEVNDHDAKETSERLPFPENQGEKVFAMDLLSRGYVDFFAGGDYLELRDLDNPTSPLSSSENSSAAISISSDECFDSLAILKELEEPIFEQNDSAKKLNVFAANKTDEFLMIPATLGSLVSIEGSNSCSDDESFKTAHMSASCSRDPNNKVAKRAKVERTDQGPSSSRKPSESRTTTKGGMKNFRKYLCFMPF
ncbi:NAC domain-containing protein 82-like [Hibiscus syriacus]|uniref:NAC domain-containing protein 82-like n=1 Tax=Hibiscus syriacus TaxID=106335 RepID=UPI0019240995|nr:NAC domain-containing protein 82-like [Hibiscus syriacus]